MRDVYWSEYNKIFLHRYVTYYLEYHCGVSLLLVYFHRVDIAAYNPGCRDVKPDTKLCKLLIGLLYTRGYLGRLPAGTRYWTNVRLMRRRRWPDIDLTLAQRLLRGDGMHGVWNWPPAVKPTYFACYGHWSRCGAEGFIHKASADCKHTKTSFIYKPVPRIDPLT